MLQCVAEPSLSMTTDASGCWRCNGRSETSWFQYEWPSAARDKDISFKELFAGVVAAVIWRRHWKGHHMRLLCDNQAVVFAWKSHSCRDRSMMNLMWHLFFTQAWFELKQWPRTSQEGNTLAYDLSHNHLSLKGSAATQDPYCATPGVASRCGRMDISSLDGALLCYSNRGVADSTRRTYGSGLRRYLSFCYALRFLQSSLFLKLYCVILLRCWRKRVWHHPQ